MHDEVKVWLEADKKPENRNKALDLGQLIPRIIAERGSFARLSEDALQHEVQKQKLANEVAGLDLQVEDEGEKTGLASNEQDDEESQQEPEVAAVSFHEARQELVELVHLAQNEAALSLDLIGLLLSGARSNISNSSASTTNTSNSNTNKLMSDFLRERVPPASLGADRLNVDRKQDNTKVAAGWKVQALKQCSQRLSDSADRLNHEIRHEDRYWHQVLKTVVRGEVLFRLRRGDTRGLGIKYGFNDAGSEFRERSVAIIKRNKQDGSMVFSNPSQFPRPNKYVKLSVFKLTSTDTIKISESSPLELLPEEEEEEEEEKEEEKEEKQGDEQADVSSSLPSKPLVENQISNARTLLFEEEMFSEVVHEARQLGAYRIEILDGKIRAMLVNEMLEIEFVECDQPTTEDDDDAVSANFRKRADLLLGTLRLLQCQSYKRNLAKRHQTPAPLSSSEDAQAKKTRPIPFILRPLLSHLHHHKMVGRVRRLLEMTFESGDISKIGEDKKPNLLTMPKTTFRIQGPGYFSEIQIGSLFQPNTPLYSIRAQRKNQTNTTEIEFYELSELEHYLSWYASDIK